MPRLIYVLSHPAQYQIPLILAMSEKLNVLVVYTRVTEAMPHFEADYAGSVDWGFPMLTGYEYVVCPPTRSGWALDGFRDLLRESGPDTAVLFHGYHYRWSLASVLTAKQLRLVTAVRSDIEENSARGRGFKRRAKDWALNFGLFRLFDYFCVVGSKNALFYKKRGVKERQIVDVPFAVDNDLFARGCRRGRIREEWGARGSDFVLLYVGKLTPGKRVVDAIEALSRLEDARLVVVGDGPDRQRLEGMAKSLCEGRVSFVGFRPPSDLPDIYASADLFIFPVEQERWGLVVNESLAAGTPVICSTEAGAAEDMLAATPYLIHPPRDVDAIVEAVALVRSGYPDMSIYESTLERHSIHSDVENLGRLLG